MEKIYVAEPISFCKRFLNKFFVLFSAPLILIMSSIYYINIDIGYKVIAFIAALGVFLFLAYKPARYHFNKVTIANESIYFDGYFVNKPIRLAEDIKKVKIQPNTMGSRAGHKGYYLTFIIENKEYYINNYFNWKDKSVIDLFRDFKNAKDEKITLDEKIILKLTKY